ncbi:hypothetical protein [Jeotgalibacillus sp. R-1-5s-1]|uniref:hypothetical protein n=1 Tax=Jeotgalibacillus sp. R-1-5s-1 TaxID=2555897 RepID=UPI001068DFEA|nr:hypothetical protein [Jeotgalibacillus sp. R-1-5s-1]TFD97042.1 hypothetical protein E2491_10120 [Jeotgalibacillus sp. R-1-5s-1]
MKKVVVSTVLASSLLFSGVASSVLPISGQFISEVKAAQMKELGSSKILNKDIDPDAYTGVYTLVRDLKPGTLVVEIHPSNTSSWNGKDTLNFNLTGFRSGNTYEIKRVDQLTDEKGSYLKAYIYVSEPLKDDSVDFTSNKGQYGYDAFEYKVFYAEGQDLTKGSVVTSAPSVLKKVYWEGAELRKGQKGKIVVKKSINLWKRDVNNKLTLSRVLNPGEEYRVYSYDNLYFGQYGLGAGLFITKMDGFIEYLTPSKAKYDEVNRQGKSGT